MRKIVLAVFGALLISGMMVQAAAAATHHTSPAHRSKAYFGRDLSDYRGAYNQMNGTIGVTPRAPDRFDPSRPGSDDPSLNPPGS